MVVVPVLAVVADDVVPVVVEDVANVTVVIVLEADAKVVDTFSVLLSLTLLLASKCFKALGVLSASVDFAGSLAELFVLVVVLLQLFGSIDS